MTEGLRLAHAPIVEAVVEINCDLPPGTDWSQLQERAQGALGTSYPKSTRQMTRRDVRAPGADVVSGLQFKSEDEREVVQMRAQGYSFNRLAPYTSLDDYLPHIERSWNIFRELTGTPKIRAITLRFINRIMLPTIHGRVELQDYLRVSPQLPDETLEFTGFLNLHSAVEVKTGNQVNITLIMEPLAGDRLPMILDIETLASRPDAPDDWQAMRKSIFSLRSLKNRVFERTLTEKCLNLFR
jgi:uncharacterized protein (TIGR04255 family)